MFKSAFISIFFLIGVITSVSSASPANGVSYAPVDVEVDGDQIHVQFGERTVLAPYDGRYAIPLFSFPDQTEENPACNVDYTIEAVEGGFNIVFSLSNDGDKPAVRPAVSLSGFRMESDVETRRDEEGTTTAHIDCGFNWLDGRDVGRVRTSMRRWSPQRYGYPGDLYSPVMAAWDSGVAVGLSLIYDPCEVKHNLFTEYTIRDGRLFMRYLLHAPLSRTVPGDYTLKLPPGETADYRLAVRFTRPEPDRDPHSGWLDALEPYREYFRERYGNVRYKRDLRPVFGQPMAQTQFVKQNDRGFQPVYNVGETGWQIYIERVLRSAVEQGYRRVMIWTPSGVYRIGSNYPTEFMTEWPERLVETLPQLLAFKQEHDITLGMWWGRASQVSGGWNTGEMWIRDVRDPVDVQAAWSELDLAHKRETDEIGLDAYGYPHLWDRYEFMEKMRGRYSEINFISEAADCDIMHTLAPTFMTFDRQSQPPALADWLVPGHESWIMLRWQQVNQKNFNKITGWKCVPVTLSRGIEHDAESFSDVE